MWTYSNYLGNYLGGLTVTIIHYQGSHIKAKKKKSIKIVQMDQRMDSQ